MNKRELMIPMRDGVKLYTELYMPDGIGPWPVLLVRTIYSIQIANQMFHYNKVTENGYIFIVQNGRGFYCSEGEFNDPTCEAEDGYDTLDWISKQEWCDGNIAMEGSSYNGYAAFAAASLRHPNLKTLIGDYVATVFSGLGFYDKGISALSHFSWGATQTQKEIVLDENSTEIKKYILVDRDMRKCMMKTIAPNFDSKSDEGKKILCDYKELSLRAVNCLKDVYDIGLYQAVKQMKDVSPWTEPWFIEIDNPDYFKTCDFTIAENTPNIPTIQVTGWYDHFIKDAFKLFNANKENGVYHRIVVTPNDHTSMVGHSLLPIGEQIIPNEFTNDSVFSVRIPKSEGQDRTLNWLDYWLKDVSSDIEERAPIMLFVQGENKYRDEFEWPLARTVWTPCYISSSGDAGKLLNDGKLTFEKNYKESSDTDKYTYDPHNPVPSLGGAICAVVGQKSGVFEQSEIEQRSDVLIYTTKPLENDIEITGPLKMVLYASTSGVDTDFTTTLTIVDSDDRSNIVSFGVCRLRHRENKKGLVVPGEIQEVEVELAPTSYLIKKGKRLRIQVSSSSFQTIDPNPNTGKSLLTDPTNEIIIANQVVYHTETYPSHILLPVIPR